MSGKIRNDDWERLFGPHAPRRGGPLRVLANVLLAVVIIAALGAGTVFLLRYRDQQQVIARANATALAATMQPLATATTLAQTQTAAAVIAAQTAAAQPTAVGGLGVSLISQGGNLRREPAIADDNIIGLLWAGDEVALLEQRDIGGQVWYRVQVLTPAANRAGEGAAAGVEGWASALLLSQ